LDASDIVKREKHQNRWFARVGARPGASPEDGLEAVSVSKSSTLTECSPADPAGERENV